MAAQVETARVARRVTVGPAALELAETAVPAAKQERAARVALLPVRPWSHWIDRARARLIASPGSIKSIVAGHDSSSGFASRCRRSIRTSNQNAKPLTQRAVALRASRQRMTARRFNSPLRRALRACKAPAPLSSPTVGSPVHRVRPASPAPIAASFSQPAPRCAPGARTATIRRCRCASSDPLGTLRGCSALRAASRATPSEDLKRRPSGNRRAVSTRSIWF